MLGCPELSGTWCWGRGILAQSVRGRVRVNMGSQLVSVHMIHVLSRELGAEFALGWRLWVGLHMCMSRSTVAQARGNMR